MNMKFRAAWFWAIALSVTPAFAQQPDNAETSLSAVKAPAQVMVGQATPVTIESGNRAPRWCGLVIDFGDGDVKQFKIGSGSVFPVTASKTYQQPGNYTIKAFGRRITTHSACSGEVTAQISVGNPVQARAPAGVSNNCPQTVNIRNAAGAEVPFGLRQMVADAGGIQPARDQVAKRLMDTQEKALDDKLPVAERENAKQFAVSLRTLREVLSRCQ
jgi:hypothetical protein